MDKHEILESVRKIHELSILHSTYQEAAKKCTGKYCEISRWADEIEAEIKDIKKRIRQAYRDLLYNDVFDKYLCRTNVKDDGSSYICIFHVTDVAELWKSVHYKYDCLFVPVGEYLRIRFDKDNNVESLDYVSKGDEYEHCAGYLTSNHIYHLIPESLNGWKEIDKETYDSIMSVYRPKEKIFGIVKAQENSKEFRLNTQGEDSFLYKY